MSPDIHPESTIRPAVQPEPSAPDKVLVQYAATFLLLVDTSFRITHFSDFAAQYAAPLLHQPLQVGLPVTDLLPATLRPEAIKVLEEARNGHTVNFFFDLAGKSKTIVHFQAILTPVPDGTGGTSGIVITAKTLPGTRSLDKEPPRKNNSLVLFRGIPIPAIIYHPETLQILEVNNSGLQHYGYSEAEMLHMTLPDLHPAEEQAKIRAELVNSKDQGGVVIRQWCHVKKDGAHLDVEVWIGNIEMEGHHQRIAIVNDVSRKKRTEHQLLESNERFRLAAKASSDAVYDWDLVSGKLHWGEGLTALFGWTGDEVTLEVWTSLVHPDDRQRVLDSLHQTIQDPAQSFWRSEYRFANRNGQWHSVLERGYIVRDEAGKPFRCVGAVQDNTGIRENEKALQESNERFTYVLNATSDIVWDWDVHSDFVLLSKHYQTVLGWSLPENNIIPANTVFTRIHPDDQDRVDKQFEQSLFHSQSSTWENAYRYQRSDGSYAFLMARAYIIRNEEGKPVRLIGALHDISEQQYQQDLQELELQVYALSSRPGATLNGVLAALVQGVAALHENMPACIALFDSGNQPSIIAPGFHQAQTAWLQSMAIQIKGKSQPEGTGIETHLLKEEDQPKGAPVFEGSGQVWTVQVWLPGEGLMAMLLLFVPGLRSASGAQLNAFLRLQNLLRTLVVHHHSVEQIRIAHERFDTVLRATHDLIWDWNIQTNVFYRSPEGMRQIYGATFDMITTTGVQEWIDRVHPEDRPKVEDLIKNARENGGARQFELEYRVRRTDGTYAWVYDRGQILRTSEGRAIRMIGAAQDISERKRLEAELLQKELDRQKEISQATIDTQEQERAEIGKELHDNVNQILTTTKLYLDLAQSSPELQGDLLEKATRNVMNVINEIRQLSRSLMDPSLGDLGLVDSVKNLVEDLNLTRQLDIRLKTVGRPDEVLDRSKKLMVFRIIQEALNNIVRHAKATGAVITLQHSGNLFTLKISDNGVGFVLEKTKPGAGLKNIKNRIYLINGNLDIKSAPKKGTTIKITFKIQENPKYYG